MKTPYEVRPEGTDAALTELSMRHRQAESYYRDTAKAFAGKNPGAADWFQSLADYRRDLYTELNGVLKDITNSPHTPSHSGSTYLKEHEQQYTRAFNAGNVAELAQMAYEEEKAISEVYRHLLADKNILDFAEEVLHQQHEKVLDMELKADRYKTVPQNGNEDKR